LRIPQVEKSALDDGGNFELVVDSDWTPVSLELNRLRDECDVLTILLGDPEFGGDVRWVGVLDLFEPGKEQTVLTLSCIEGVAPSYPISSLEPHPSAERWEAGLNLPMICNSPGLIREYLVRNEIEPPAEENRLLFDRCILFRQVPEELTTAETSDIAGDMVLPIASIETLALLFSDAEWEGKLLNAIFADPDAPECVGWVATITDVEVRAKDARVVYEILFDFRQADPRLPLTLVSPLDNEGLDAFEQKSYEVCEQNWLVNDCLNEIFRGPTADDFYEAFMRARISEKQRAMLAHHHSAPEMTISMPRLAVLMGYKNFNAANLHYGKLAGTLAEIIGVPIGGDNLGLFAFPSEETDDAGYFQWTMRAELAEALQKLGWVGSAKHLAECIPVSH
jgi:hypothetical protein